MPRAIDFVSLFIASLAIAFIGWAVVVLSSRMERRCQEVHLELLSEHLAAESHEGTQRRPWIHFLARWLLP
jgi:hypothetical protein